MRGIDDLKKWSEETAEYVVEKKADANKGQGDTPTSASKANVPQEIDLLGLDDIAPIPAQSQPTSTLNQTNKGESTKTNLPAPPLKKQNASKTVDMEIDLLGGDFGGNPTSQSDGQTMEVSKPMPVGNLDLFDLNLNM